MPRNSDREDFLTDYDPNWGNDKERDYEDDDRAADFIEDDEEDVACPDCKCTIDSVDPGCQCPCHVKG